jgi:hypothetical protein
MIELYKSKGLSKADAEAVISILSKHKHCFVDVMMKEELLLIPPDQHLNPIINGTICSLKLIVLKYKQLHRLLYRI